MNKERIMQIVAESADIPEDQFNTANWYELRDGKATMCPIGKHLLEHPETRDSLGWKELSCAIGGKTVVRWDIDYHKFENYLDVSRDEWSELFNCQYKTYQEFADTINAFMDGMFEMRECRGDGCYSLYFAMPDDKSQVCDNCYDRMMELLGL